MSIESKAHDFKRQHKLTELTYDSLSDTLSTLGYSIVEYGALNSESVKSLISVHGLERYTVSRSFTFTDSFNKLIFLDSSLSEKDKLIYLAHEAGHIVCGHSIDATGAENKDADLFADYLLGLHTTGKKTKVLVGIVLVIVIITVALIIFWLNSYYGEYYVTEFGEKYHLKDCMYVENAEHPRRFTMADYYSGKYEPCQVCEPEKDGE